MKYPLACDTWDNREVEAIQEVVKTGRYTMGPYVKKFEKEFCDYFKCNDAVMVNSGSSANLLMLATLALKHKLKGDIIVPAVSWSTTYYPLQQYGFKLNFVDIDKSTLNIDPSKIEKAITKDTCAIFAVNLLGNSCEYKKINEIAEKHNLMVIEDNCESLGAISDTDIYNGVVGHMGSYSFFFSHHLQTMEGGMIACKSKDDADFIRSLRAHGWCRDLPDDNTIYKKSGDTFVDSFTFITPGYSVRPLEMSGAIGSVQLKKWPEMREQRVKNAEYFKQKFKDLPDVQLQEEVGNSSWFGFSMVFNGNLSGKRAKIVEKFKENEIESRPIVAGNFMKNPVIKYLDYIDNKDYNVADYIHDNGLFIGNDVRDLKENIDMVYNIIKDIK
jgi:dTDP-4-amino-4,6-dideoxygalactose transaminase|tara:strand:- start:1461 stop:2618 length:1158 start_codon:yes stop_codon:yes gene_type:complete